MAYSSCYAFCTGLGGRNGQLSHYLVKRISYVKINNRRHVRHCSTVSNTQVQAYSTRTTKAAIKAYHKRGINGFVYNLSTEEREQLLQMLTKASEVGKLPEKVPMPSRDQLRYGNYVIAS